MTLDELIGQHGRREIAARVRALQHERITRFAWLSDRQKRLLGAAREAGAPIELLCDDGIWRPFLHPQWRNGDHYRISPRWELPPESALCECAPLDEWRQIVTSKIAAMEREIERLRAEVAEAKKKGAE